VALVVDLVSREHPGIVRCDAHELVRDSGAGEESVEEAAVSGVGPADSIGDGVAERHDAEEGRGRRVVEERDAGVLVRVAEAGEGVLLVQSSRFRRSKIEASSRLLELSAEGVGAGGDADAAGVAGSAAGVAASSSEGVARSPSEARSAAFSRLVLFLDSS
jgi:hypothetical protein